MHHISWACDLLMMLTYFPFLQVLGEGEITVESDKPVTKIKCGSFVVMVILLVMYTCCVKKKQ